MKRRFAGKQCAYCQQRESTPGQADHVIARGFFPDGRRTDTDNPIRVPACRVCNGSFARDEQYLITLLAPALNARHPAAAEVASGPVARSTTNPKAQGVWRRIQKNAERVRLMSSGGLYTATTAAVQPEFEPYDNVFRKITKGLFYYHLGTFFPPDYEIALFNIDSALCDQHWVRMQEIGFSGPFEIGGGVFRYAYSYSGSDPATSTWLMCFYQGHYFNVLTGPPKQVGDVLQLDDNIHNISAGRYVLLARSSDEATLCLAATDLDGNLCESPITIKAAPSCMAAFRFVGKIAPPSPIGETT